MTRTGIGIRTAVERSERITGQIHVYDGAGKGKSQAALGVVLRSIGLGIKSAEAVAFCCCGFSKGRDAPTMRMQRLKRCSGVSPLDRPGTDGTGSYFAKEEVTRFDALEAQRGWDVAKGAIASDLYSVVVLDELNPVLDLGLLSVDEVIRTLKNKPDNLEIIVTGRGTPQALLDIADLHSESVPHDHPASREQGLRGLKFTRVRVKVNPRMLLGKALQAIGRGISTDKSHRVLIMQWLKGGSGYTEDAAIAALRQSYPSLVDHHRCGRDAIVWRGQQQIADYVEAERGWEIARAALASGLYKTIIMDELNPTVDLELLQVEPIVDALLRKPRDTEVIITGRCVNQPAYFDLASVHSEMICHKHYCEKGVDLKRGVDF
jgi:cob(I)alamin adenosyltransferase